MAANRKSNRLNSSVVISDKVQALNLSYSDLIKTEEQLRSVHKLVETQREKTKEASEKLILSLMPRLSSKFFAKLPYFAIEDNRLNDLSYITKIAFDRVLRITNRGVIVRVVIDTYGRRYRKAIELSHEQIAMSSTEWDDFKSGYEKFIKDTYAPEMPM